MIIAEGAPVFLDITDSTEILNDSLLSELNVIGFRFAEQPCESQMLLVVKWLARKVEDGIFVYRGASSTAVSSLISSRKSMLVIRAPKSGCKASI